MTSGLGSITLFAFVLGLGLSTCNYIPPYFKFCNHGLPDKNKCVLEYGKEILPKLAYTGIPEYGMKPLDPMYIKKVDVLKGSTLGLVLKDTNVYGLGKAKLLDAKLDDRHILLKFIVSLELKGTYSMEGQLVLIPLKASGNYSVKIDKTMCVHQYDFELIKNKNDGLEYMHLADDELDCKTGKMTFNMENLFGDNKVLGDSINQLMTDNSDILSDDFSPPFIKAIQKTSKKAINALYSSIPFAQIFPKT